MDKEVPDSPQEEQRSPYYYTENGFVVFTEAFLLKRGFCCGNGCRHCPYGRKKGATTPLNQQPEK